MNLRTKPASVEQVTIGDTRILDFAFLCAGGNWLLWLADYTFASDSDSLPVLRHADRFAAFCKEYRPLRGVEQETREAIRKQLVGAAEFRKAVADDTGSRIEQLALGLQERFDLEGVPRSLVSKLAAFARPSRFVAWDQFARKGASRLLYRRQTSSHRNYQSYLEDVDRLWEGALGNEIRSYLDDNALPSLQGGEALGKRVLDVYLMTVGGRWGTQLSLPRVSSWPKNLQ